MPHPDHLGLCPQMGPASVTSLQRRQGVFTIPMQEAFSRLFGKVLIQHFPSVLLPLTILGHILDANRHDNGMKAFYI